MDPKLICNISFFNMYPYSRLPICFYAATVVLFWKKLPASEPDHWDLCHQCLSDPQDSNYCHGSHAPQPLLMPTIHLSTIIYMLPLVHGANTAFATGLLPPLFCSTMVSWQPHLLHSDVHKHLFQLNEHFCSIDSPYTTAFTTTNTDSINSTTFYVIWTLFCFTALLC